MHTNLLACVPCGLVPVTLTHCTVYSALTVPFYNDSFVQVVLKEHLSHIDQAKMSTSDKLQVEFQDLELLLRKRLAELESRVEETVSELIEL